MTPNPCAPRVFISAGELSGDVVAARLIESLRAASPFVRIDGVGGERMAAAGAALVTTANHIGAVGVSEGLAVVPSGVRILSRVKRHLRAERPDVAVLVGTDLFNRMLARTMRAHGIPTVALFPPQIWVWQPLVPFFARALDVVLASFPEEAQRYRAAGTKTVFVGHYLADVLQPTTPDARRAARQALGMSGSAPVVGLLPGSRTHEIQRLRPVLLETADVLCGQVPGLRAVLADRSGSTERRITTPGGLDVHQVADSHAVMRAADVVVCCSGTATLEAALLGVPMVVVYKVSRMTYAVVRLCIELGLLPSDTIALPNLILGREVVPELTQHSVVPSAIARAAAALVPDGEPRRAMCAGLAEVRALIQRPGALARSAAIVLEEAVARRRPTEHSVLVPLPSQSREGE